MKLQTVKWAPVLVAAGVLAVVCLIQAIGIWLPDGGFLQPLKWMTYDWRVRLATRYPFPCATNLAAVCIDEQCLDILGDKSLGYVAKPPFPRHVYGRMAREMAAQGAKVVAMDILFGETRPEGHSLPLVEAEQMGFQPIESERWPPFSEIKDADDAPGHKPRVRVESDDYFAVQLRQAGNVILAADTTEGEGVIPPDVFYTNAWAVSDITVDKDADGKLRRLYAFKDFRDWHREIQALIPAAGYELTDAEVKPDHIIFRKAAGTNIVLRLDAEGCFNPDDLPGEHPADQETRREKPFRWLRFWHMGIVIAARELNLDLTNPAIDLKHHRISLHGAGGIERVIPVDSEGRFLIDWSLPFRDERVFKLSLGAVLSLDFLRHSARPAHLQDYLDGLRAGGITWAGEYPFRNKLVVVGSAMIGSNLTDAGATPLDKQTYFFITHWNVANSVITGRFVRPASYLAELLLILLLGGMAAWPAWRLPQLLASLLVLALAGLYWAMGAWLYVQYRYSLPITLPLLGLGMTYVGMVTYRVVFEQKERRRVKSLFAKLVSPEVVNELLETEQFALGGGRRRVTMFFADVRGFTEMTDVNQAMAEEYVREHQLSGADADRVYDEQAREVLATVNLYLSTIADLIKKHNGTLDKYIGDCVMAFWGAPVPNDQHALCCVRSAIEAQRAIDTLNQQRQVENQRRAQENASRTAAGQPALPMLALLSLGTGINTGLVTVGLMGSDATILNYTIFGREVNLASRLEGVSGRGRIIISESTVADLQRDDPALAAGCQELAPVTVKGIRKPVKIYEVPWRPGVQTTPPEAG